ncbi:lipid-A-disaccharide synthase [Mesorhizobium australicum]|uniref:Lipid-A-disaccharide synthase n=1 Tax=Mesorhizobium australicum TaxID=536018 RepID=A0A1X7PCX2_9HYPH|nr:lipid-A-disaccharide synthase [Mesorhizobium australicum]SMH48572.1 lipid-A-disaccharide synthase [Mesorhizobium australicum]
MSDRPLRLAVVAGEESGDLLGADLVAALRAASGRDIVLTGIGGRHLEAQGLSSLFNSSEIALMGVAAVVRDLPRLIRRIGQTAREIVTAKPDCLVTIDSPDFSLRVAKKVRAADPSIPIVHYVCPSVWAWRPGRAPAMKPHVDHILCVLPFEPDVLDKLGGPEGTFVGHRLTADAGVKSAAAAQAIARDLVPGREKTLVVLPGSRGSEIGHLLKPFGETIDILRARGNRLRIVLPTLPRLRDRVTAGVAGWAQAPEIILGADEKWRAFGEADAALISSGTVSLELALAGVPLVSCYRFDWLSRQFEGLITSWSALLPNLIADRPVAPEYYNQYVRPEHIARSLECLFADTEMRAWQRDGFAEVRRRLATDRPPGVIAADVVMSHIKRKTGA